MPIFGSRVVPRQPRAFFHVLEDTKMTVATSWWGRVTCSSSTSTIVARSSSFHSSQMHGETVLWGENIKLAGQNLPCSSSLVWQWIRPVLVKMKNVQQKLCCKSHNDHKPRPEVKSIQKVWLKQNTSKPPMWGPHTRTLTASSCAIASAAICLLGQYVPWCWLYANSSFPMTTEKTREALKFTRICKRLELSSVAGKSWN